MAIRKIVKVNGRDGSALERPALGPRGIDQTVPPVEPIYGWSPLLGAWTHIKALILIQEKRGGDGEDRSTRRV